ncbi:MAG: hypothetical protein KC613_19810, partial [Myxococcales bacterium]|nr:hypothetical protein [Myxococcales bacterium]
MRDEVRGLAEDAPKAGRGVAGAAAEMTKLSAASTAAAEAADKAAAGLTRKMSPGMEAAGKAASKAWSAMRILANILPNFGIGGFILAAVAGFKLLQKAMNSSASAAETYSAVLKRAQAATEAYAKALADNPYRAAEATVAQVQLAQALQRTTDERAKYLALVGSAKDEVASAEADERGAVAALKHAASISEMAAANDRVRAAQKRRTEAQTALEFAQIKLSHAEGQHLTALKASKDAEQERALSVYSLRDAFVSATDSLIGGPGSLYSALMTIEREGKRAIGSVVEAATPKKRTG